MHDEPKPPADDQPPSEVDLHQDPPRGDRPTSPDDPHIDDVPPEGSPERREILKQIPFLPKYSNETFLYLLAVEPTALHLLWEVGEATRGELTARFGPGFLETNYLLLRVYDVTGVDFNGFNANSWFEVDDYLNDKLAYWVRVDPGRNWVAELGFRSKGTTYFEKVARSNVVFSPLGREETADLEVGRASVPVAPNDVEVPVEPGGWRFNRYLHWKQRRTDAPPEKGYWSLVLHQHLPFVRHPEYDVALEEQWFFEAVTSVYTQLLGLMQRLRRDRVDFRLTVSLTPPLLSMMRDDLLRGRAARHIRELTRLARKRRAHARSAEEAATLDQILGRLTTAKEVFDGYGGDLTRGYREFQELGKLEVITCAATHFLLPLHLHQPEMVRAQLRLACRQYVRLFDRWPRGIWLPENAFTPGLEELLEKEGIRWTLVSARALREGNTRVHHGAAAPVVTPAGVAVFGIDQETRQKIWSRQGGYPGSPNYKEWYRDLGYDLPWEELPRYFRTADVRRNAGLKLHRIGDPGTPLGDKPPYVPAWAQETVEQQAGQFVWERGAQANAISREQGGMKPIIVSAYDAELYGHWWEEGIDFLESVFRRMANEQTEVRPVTPGEYLAEHPTHQRMVPGAGSWGKGDYFGIWVEEREGAGNEWVYRHLFRLAGKLTELAGRYRSGADPLRTRALNQAARCLFLAGASDWGFLISTGQAGRYAANQVVTRLDRAAELLRQADTGDIKVEYLETIESADCLFPFEQMDYRVFCRDGS